MKLHVSDTCMCSHDPMIHTFFAIILHASLFFQHVQKNRIQVPLRTLAAVGAMSEASAWTACTAWLRRG